MKIHYNASIFPSTNIVIECGVGGNGIPATTDPELVTCKRCLGWLMGDRERPNPYPEHPVVCADDDGILIPWRKL